MNPNRKAQLEDVLPVMTIEGNTMFMWNGAVALGFEVSGYEQETLEPQEYTEINQTITSALRSLPMGTLIQKMDIYFEKEVKGEENPQQVFTNKVKQKLEEKPVMFHKSYIFIAFPKLKRNKDKQNVPKSNSILNLFTKFSSPIQKGATELYKTKLDALDGIEERLELLPQAHNFMERLSAIIPKFQYRVLDHEDIEILYKQYFNLEFDKAPASYCRSIVNDTKSLTIGEKKANIISLTQQGQEAFDIVFNGYGVISPQVFGLTHYLNHPHILITNLVIENTEQKLKEVDFSKKIVSGFASNNQNSKIKIKQMEEFTALVRSENNQLVSLGMHILVWSEDDQKRLRVVEDSISAISRIQKAECLVETMDMMNLYFALAPGNAHESIRYLLSTPEVALTYTHFIEPTKSNSTGIFFGDRQKNVVQVELYDTNKNNQNAIIVGPPGSGKSFTGGYLMVQRDEQPKTKQIIIDIGGTYRNIVEAICGLDTYFEYSLEKPMKFNPFLMKKEDTTHRKEIVVKISDECEEIQEEIIYRSYAYLTDEQKQNFLVTLIGVLLLDEGTNFNNEQKAIITELVNLYYEHINERIRCVQEVFAENYFKAKKISEAGIDIPEELKNLQKPSLIVPKFADFFHFVLEYYSKLEKSNPEEYQRFTQAQSKTKFETILKPYATGVYKAIFDSDTVENLDEHRLIVFDLDKIKQNPSLYRVVSMLIMQLSYDLCDFKANEYRKYIYMDEAWKMISGAMKDWVEEMFRTIRKRNGSFNLITQSMIEIDQLGLVGEAIKLCADIRIVLRHNTDVGVMNYLQQSSGFTYHERTLIESIRSFEDSREIFIKNGNVGKVYTLLTPIEINGLLSSKPVETNLIKKLKNFYKGNIHYALNQFKEHKESNKNLDTINID
ncbi:MAG: hypothetical protein MUC49_22360 [Raineya sp.]|jgi:type IV secretory pathway VirB4 component|nr:hypothetical protein [Raineya sp.]